MHMPLHQQARDDGLATHSHRQQQLSEADGFQALALPAVKHKEYHRIHSQDSPSDIHGTPLSDNLHQKAYYEPQEVNLLLEALFETILWGIQEHRQYLHGRVHASENINTYNSTALAG